MAVKWWGRRLSEMTGGVPEPSLGDPGSRLRPRRHHIQKLALVVCGVLGGYLILEAAGSTWQWCCRPGPTSFWVFEESWRTVRFDPVLGYRLETTPSRTARITKGKPEYVGVLKGNAQGFPGRDEFGPRRRSPHTKRIAVFGDSFTAGTNLQTKWPDRVADRWREAGRHVELLNLAQDAVGLGNWWSVLTRKLEREHYELDGIVFAIYEEDLQRRFGFADHSDKTHQWGAAPGWDPRTFPATLDEARRAMTRAGGHLLTTADFDDALRGTWRPPVDRRFRLVVAGWLSIGPDRLGRWLRTVTSPTFDEGQAAFIAHFRRFIRERNLPAHVFTVPSRARLLGTRDPAPDIKEARLFAREIGAEFVDGVEAFERLSPEEVRGHWLPYDGHWNQLGSDRFAQFVGQRLHNWPPARP